LQLHSAGDSSGEIDEAAKEWEHTLIQSTMDKELNELNKRLEQKEVLFVALFYKSHTLMIRNDFASLTIGKISTLD